MDTNDQTKTISDDQLTALADLAVDLAVKSGDMARERVAAGVNVAATKSSTVDVVTEIDISLEKFIRARLAVERPDDGILGEEDEQVTGTSGLTWVIDPIDGTTNLLYGMPDYSVSVAVVRGDGDPATSTALAGCVHRPTDGATWHAVRGRGAWRGSDKLTIDTDADFAHSMVGTGFGYEADLRGWQGRVLADLLPQIRDIRRLGSSAIDLCLVAEGQMDLMYERGLSPWDMAAGALVVIEAGGVVEDFDGNPGSEEMTMAGPPHLVRDLRTALLAAGARFEDRK